MGVFQLVGASQDGRAAVLEWPRLGSTTFAVVSPGRTQLVKLAGKNWGFDALRGNRLVLIRYRQTGYEIRLYDLATSTLAQAPLKDPHGSELIWGSAFARASSPDGRILYTLYIGPNGGTMIHALDLVHATARCIDLPGTGNYNAAITTALAVSHDGRTVYAVAPGYSRVTAVDTASRKVRWSVRANFGAWANDGAGMATLSPDGKRLAVTDARHLWFVDLPGRRVRIAGLRTVVGLGWSPGRRDLWVVGKGSRVSRLSPG